MSDTENFPLDDAMIGLLADLNSQQKQLENQALTLHAQRQGALVYFIRQHKLQGNWKLAENGRELERTEPQPAPAAAE